MNNTQQAGETAKVIAILKKELQTQELVKQHYKMQTDQKLKAQGYKGPFAPAHDEDLISQLSSVIKVLTESTPAPDAVEAKGMEWNDIDSPPEPLEVIVLIEGNEYNAYYTDDKWWVDYGGMTVGHKMIDEADIEGWRLPAAALTSSSAPAEQVDVTLLAKMASLAYSKDPEKTKAFEYGFALGMSHAEGQKATVSEDRVQKLLTEAPVPCLLTWALKYCNSDQLAALRDGLIYRTPSTAAPSAKSAGDVFELVDVEINPAVSGEYRVVFPDGNSGLFEYEAEIDMWVNTYGGEDEWFLGEEAKYYRPIIPTSHAEGEKGAVGFAEWIAQNDWSFSPVSQMWHNSGSAKLTSELYKTYLKEQ